MINDLKSSNIQSAVNKIYDQSNFSKSDPSHLDPVTINDEGLELIFKAKILGLMMRSDLK